MKDVLIIKFNTRLHPQVMHNLREAFLEQVKEGVVIIPSYAEAKLISVPDNVEVVIEDIEIPEEVKK